MEVFEICRFELWEVIYKSFVRNFYHAREILSTKEMFELWEVELQRANCTKYFIN